MSGYIPSNLEECFTQLDAELKPEDVKKIISGSEHDLFLYHHGLGMTLRNRWGLWSGSRLAKFFNAMGLYHPDDISMVIITSYWRHKNDKPLDVNKQIERYTEYWERNQKQQYAEERRAKTAKAEITKRMMNLKLVNSQCPVIELKHRKSDGIRVRYAANLDDSIFITAKYSSPAKDKKVATAIDNFSIACYSFDKNTKQLSRIFAKELNSIDGGIVSNNCAYLFMQETEESDSHTSFCRLEHPWLWTKQDHSRPTPVAVRTWAAVLLCPVVSTKYHFSVRTRTFEMKEYTKMTNDFAGLNFPAQTS
jgi:hypothetical protein